MKLSFGQKKKKEKERGRLIVIDGIDGSGKSTQINLLLQTLAMSDYQTGLLDFPQYGQKSAGMVEEYLHGKYKDVSPYAASIFYAVDRFDAAFKIRQMLSEKKIIISDRYVTANAGHQGGKILDSEGRVKFFKWLDNLEYNIFNIPKPDLNIILDMPAKAAQKLIDKKTGQERKYLKDKKRDMHENDIKHLENARQVYLEIVNLFPNTKLVHCVENKKLLTPQEIHTKVWDLVRRIALKDFKN